MSFLPQFKSVQRGTITITSTNTSNTATVSSVTVANSFVRLLGVDTDSNVTLRSSQAAVSLTNATTVTASRSSSSGAVIVSFEVVELFILALKSATQEFAVSLAGAASGTATIASVSTAKSEIVWRGCTYTGDDSDPSRAPGRLTLTNSTTVTGNRTSSTNTLTLYGTVVEWR